MKSETKSLSNPVSIHQKLLEVIQLSKQSFVAMGALLHELYEEEKYLDAVGEGIDTWEDYLKQPEIGLSTKEASRLMQIYQVFCLEHGFNEDLVAEIPVKNLHYLLPVAKKMGEEGHDDLEDLMVDAKQLTQTDFRERIYDVKTDEKGERTYTYSVMKRCDQTNTLSKVHGIEHDEILEVFKDRIYAD